jgi:hypothetical protein
LVKKLLLIVAALLLVAAPVYWLAHEPRTVAPEPVQILSRYLKASYARDFRQAYRFISSKDKQLKPEKVYVREQGAFRGFTLEVARKLSGFITARPLQLQPEGDLTRVTVALRLPDANSLTSLLMEWDEDRLNALPLAERQKLLAAIDRLYRSGKMKMIEGNEEFLMAKEGNTWKLVLDWGQGLHVSFGSSVPVGGPLEATQTTPGTVVRSGEPFKVTYRVKNRSQKILSTRIIHKVEPIELRQYLDIVECALLVPVKLLPGKETEYSTTYAVRPDLPGNTREMNITYEFKVEP